MKTRTAGLTERQTMKRHCSLFHLSTIVSFGTAVLCLFPLTLKSANTSDIGAHLSAYAQNSQSLEKTGHHMQTRHSDEILAALTIYLEARGESFAGKMAVAAVIRNRMNHKYHSDGTVKGTVLRAFQFEPWIKRSPEDIRFNPRNKKMQESLMAWRLVQDGRNIVEGAVLFYNPTIVSAPRWAKVNRKVATIGGHEFFNRHQI